MLYPNIAAERARHGMSMDELAEKLGVCRKTLYNWRDKGKIPETKLKAMARLFNVTTDYLLDRSVSE